MADTGKARERAASAFVTAVLTQLLAADQGGPRAEEYYILVGSGLDTTTDGFFY